MKNERAWANELVGSVGEVTTRAARRTTWLSLSLFLITFVLCLGIYVAGQATLQNYDAKSRSQSTGFTASGLLHSFSSTSDPLLFLARGYMGALVAAGVLGSGGMLWLVRRRLTVTRKGKLDRLQLLPQKIAGYEAEKTLLQSQLLELEKQTEQQLQTLKADWHKQRTEAEARINELTRTNTLLQDELNKRSRAERALAQKRQELESSKSVLEVHVEARNEELQKLQNRYELILNSAGEGICGLNLDGNATFVNPAVARMTGWRVEELIGKSEAEIFYRNGSSSPPAPDGQTWKEQVFFHKDGGTFPVEFVKTPIQEKGRTVGSVLVFKDITERRRVEQTLARKADELARSNAELEQFAFVASHDLQEPLRKIQAFGERVKAKMSGEQSADARSYLERMQKAAARMQTLIDDLLTFSRVIRNSQPFAQVNLSTITREVLADLEVRVEQTGAKIEVGDLPTIEADPMQMRQLLLNLIGNALKFQPPGNTPHIRVLSRRVHLETAPARPDAQNGQPEHCNGENNAAASLDEFCEISIEDNGIGFEERYLDRIFVVFQRLEGRSDYEGTGVGLAVCRRITDRHGGKITARSKPGHGSTFIVTLPAKQSKPEVSQ